MFAEIFISGQPVMITLRKKIMEYIFIFRDYDCPENFAW
jgi:hypothetical protein